MNAGAGEAINIDWNKMASSWTLDMSDNFCLTVSLRRSPEEVVGIYGADAKNALWVPLQEAPEAPRSGTSLRAGVLGEWAFCIEFENPIGSTAAIMRDLSAQTECLVLLTTAKGLTAFYNVVDGEVVEWFEPGNPSSTQDPSLHGYADEMHGLTEDGLGPVAASLRSIARCVGHELTTELLHGPLLSVVIDDFDREALEDPDPPLLFPAPPPGNYDHLGRPL